MPQLRLSVLLLAVVAPLQGRASSPAAQMADPLMLTLSGPCDRNCSIPFSLPPKQWYRAGRAAKITLFGGWFKQLKAASVRFQSDSGFSHTESYRPRNPDEPAVDWVPCTGNRQFWPASIDLEFDAAYNVSMLVQQENITLGDGMNHWYVGGSDFTYRRVPPARPKRNRQLTIRSRDASPAVACLRNQCLENRRGGLSEITYGCRHFTKCATLLLSTNKEWFLYVQVDSSNSQRKLLNISLEASGEHVGISCEKESKDQLKGKSLQGRTNTFIADKNRKPKSSVPSPTAYKDRAKSQPKSSQSPGSVPAHSDLGPNTFVNVQSASGARHGVPVAPNSHLSAEVSPHQPITNSANGNTVNLSVNVGAAPGSWSASVPAPAVAAAPERRAPVAPERRIPKLVDQHSPTPNSASLLTIRWDDQSEALVRREVARSSPVTLQLGGGALFHSESNLVRFELNSTGPVYIALHGNPSPVLRITSNSGGSVSRELCRPKLTDGVMRATVSTDSEMPVAVTATIRAERIQLRMDHPLEVDVMPQQPAVTKFRFPDWKPHLMLKSQLGPSQCMLLSVLKRACEAVSGDKHVAVLHKYVSGSDQLPIQRDLFNRTAYVRAEWAEPSFCGLPPPAAQSATHLVTRALLGLTNDEDSGWVTSLLPALIATGLLPTIVISVVRSATARLKRLARKGGATSDDDDNEGVVIEEMHPGPRAITAAPALGPTILSANPSGSTSSGRATVLQEAGYEDAGKPQPSQSAALPMPSAAVIETPGSTYLQLSDLKRQLSHVTYPELDHDAKRQLDRTSGQLGEETQAPLAAEPAAAGPSGDGDHGRSVAAKHDMASQLGVGGGGGAPSAPDQTAVEAGSALLPRSPRRVLPAVGSNEAQLQVQNQPLQLPRSAPGMLCWCTPVLAVTAFDVVPPLQDYRGGNLGACMLGPLGPLAGLVLLAPSVAFVATIRWVRHRCNRVSVGSDTTNKGGDWPLPGSEWILAIFGIQASISALCPGSLKLLTDNMFPVSLLAAVTVLRLRCPARCALTPPLPTSLAGSALVATRNWLPATVRTPALVVSSAVMLGTATRTHLQAVLPNASAWLQLRAAVTRVPHYTLVLTVGNLAVAAAGVWMSDDGFLALFASFNSAGIFLLTAGAKEQRGLTWPCRTHWRLSTMSGFGAFVFAAALQELQHFRQLGIGYFAATATPLFYMISMLLLIIGAAPRIKAAIA